MQKISSVSYKARLVLAGASLLAIIGVFAFSTMMVPQAQADNIDAQINALMQENSNNQNVVNDLQNKAVSYQDAINKLLKLCHTRCFLLRMGHGCTMYSHPIIA